MSVLAVGRALADFDFFEVRSTPYVIRSTVVYMQVFGGLADLSQEEIKIEFGRSIASCAKQIRS